MRTRFLYAIALCATATFSAVSPAHATPTQYANRTSFNAAAGATLQEDFQDAHGTLPALVSPPLDASTSNSTFNSGDIVGGVRFGLASTGSFAVTRLSLVIPNTTIALGSPAGIAHVITFGAPITAFALDLYTTTNTQFSVDLRDAQGASIGSPFSLTPTLVNGLGVRTSFFGVTVAPPNDPQIASVVISAPAGSVFLDNVTFTAIPEPGTLALQATVALGAAGIFAARLYRRRRRA